MRIFKAKKSTNSEEDDTLAPPSRSPLKKSSKKDEQGSSSRRFPSPHTHPLNLPEVRFIHFMLYCYIHMKEQGA
jgi:hypothetical protein